MRIIEFFASDNERRVTPEVDDYSQCHQILKVVTKLCKNIESLLPPPGCVKERERLAGTYYCEEASQHNTTTKETICCCCVESTDGNAQPFQSLTYAHTVAMLILYTLCTSINNAYRGKWNWRWKFRDARDNITHLLINAVQNAIFHPAVDALNFQRNKE